jgi:multiple sugar transport system ATP-binding protein
MASVTLQDIKKVYDKEVVAVHDFNLEVADKEFVVLVGPSGCGKSTTLRMIAGLEDISAGELHIDGRRMNDVPPKDRDIAMVFQNYALYPHMTVADNMAFALKLRKVPKAEIREKVAEAARILDITPLLERKPKALSGGQRQRVAIGRAIVRNPKVFLMDEPLSNLDAKLRNQMRAELIKLRREIDTTFIYVTHDQTEAMTLGDRIVIMSDGYIQQIGTPNEVFSSPNNKFVAGFIGSPQMNFLAGKLLQKGGKYSVSVLGLEMELTAEQQAKVEKNNLRPQAEMDVEIGVRPEHFRLRESGAADVIRGKTEISEMMGSEVYIHMTLGETPVVLRSSLSELPTDYLTEAGAINEIGFNFPVKRIQIFDRESGANFLRSAE